MKKKVLLSLTLVFVLLLVAGCGKNENILTCSNKQDIMGITINSTSKMTFVSDKVSKVNLVMDVVAESDLMKQNWEQVVKTYEEQYKPEKKDGFELSVKNDDKNHKFIINYDINLDKVSKETLASYNLDSMFGAEDSLETAKSDLEKAGFTCKK